MDLTNLTFIDVETTGLSPARDRIIEIGILRVRNGRVVKKLDTLINPGCAIPPEITLLTGITARDLENAPSFRLIADDIEALLNGSLFVAHNARFDYAFIKSEFARLEHSVTLPTLCTAKLSRRLYPRFRRHNLDSIIARFGIACGTRHRAFSDAKVLKDFYALAKKQFGIRRLTDAARDVTKTSALPRSIDRTAVQTLPETPGVYIFYGQHGQPLYIGKSVNIKSRVQSHFYEYAQSGKEARIFQTIESIEAIRTSGELGALLLESEMIKKMQPLYNRQLRKNRALIALFRTETEAGYYSVEQKELARVPLEDIEQIIAVFRTRRQAKEALTVLSREHELCKKLLGIEKTKGACFGYQIHTCHGACIGGELPIRYNMRFAQAFAATKVRQWPFPGAIAIREGGHAHIVYKWCYLGTDRQYSEQATFDYDAYKILVSHLLRKTKNAQIHIVDPNMLQ